MSNEVTKQTRPRLGTKLEGTQGAILIAYTHEHDGGYGMLPHGVGIALLPHNEFHPYVVWTIISANEGETWFAESGQYCMRIGEALAQYYSRGGKDGDNDNG